jgi:hypothetical protein
VEKAVSEAGSAANARWRLAVGCLICGPNRRAQSSNRGLFWCKLKMMMASRQESLPKKTGRFICRSDRNRFRTSGNDLKHMFDISAELC